MSKFSVYAHQFNGKVNFQVIKANQGSAANKPFEYLGTVEAISAKKAEDLAKVRLASGLFKLTYAPDESQKKIAIFLDYNGVLDSYENTRMIEKEKPELQRGDFFFLKATVNHEHVFKIAQLAIEYNAIVVTTSEFRRDGINFYDLIRATITQRGTDEQKAFVQENKRTLRGLCIEKTGVGRSRNDEVAKYVEENGITHCVVLEDDHHIDEIYNRIWVSGFHGLSEKNLEQLREYLISF